MLNKDKFVQISLVIAIILLAVLIYISFINKTALIKKSYYAVYLRTGDLYFGHLSKLFFRYTLTNVFCCNEIKMGILVFRNLSNQFINQRIKWF